MRRISRLLQFKKQMRVGSPRSVSYPGVYVEEVSSSVRTIAGRSTSTTAFLGRAHWGPVGVPTTLSNFADFERLFGGLWQESQLGYSIKDFFLNGGSRALVVRLEDSATHSLISIPSNGNPSDTIPLIAANPGAWGQSLKATVDYLNVPPDDSEHFNLLIERSSDGFMEHHLKLSMQPHSSRFLGALLEQRSSLLKLDSESLLPASISTNRPASGVYLPTANSGSDGNLLSLENFVGTGKQAAKEGLYALERAECFNLLVIPPYKSTNDVDSALVSEAAIYCERKRAFYIVDPPTQWTNASEATANGSSSGTESINAAIYFPRMLQTDVLDSTTQQVRAPSGAIAGLYARTDHSRGVWKAPAGTEAQLKGFISPEFNLSSAQAGDLNNHHINPIRRINGLGTVVYGSRTIGGTHDPEWRYVPVRRLGLFLLSSIELGTQWAVFEPNKHTLWKSVTLSVEKFLNEQWRRGAFAGSNTQEAYFIRCGLGQTMTQADIDRGRLIIEVGFAPLKPAEFIILRIEQKTADS